MQFSIADQTLRNKPPVRKGKEYFSGRQSSGAAVLSFSNQGVEYPDSSLTRGDPSDSLGFDVTA